MPSRWQPLLNNQGYYNTTMQHLATTVYTSHCVYIASWQLWHPMSYHHIHAPTAELVSYTQILTMHILWHLYEETTIPFQLSSQSEVCWSQNASSGPGGRWKVVGSVAGDTLWTKTDTESSRACMKNSVSLSKRNSHKQEDNWNRLEVCSQHYEYYMLYYLFMRLYPVAFGNVLTWVCYFFFFFFIDYVCCWCFLM